MIVAHIVWQYYVTHNYVYLDGNIKIYETEIYLAEDQHLV